MRNMRFTYFENWNGIIIWVVAISFLILFFGFNDALAVELPGTNKAGEMRAAGTLLQIFDTAIFSWGARLVAGLLILSSVVAIKNQTFGVAGILIVGALIAGTTPMWVENIFKISNGDTLFSKGG